MTHVCFQLHEAKLEELPQRSLQCNPDSNLQDPSEVTTVQGGGFWLLVQVPSTKAKLHSDDVS